MGNHDLKITAIISEREGLRTELIEYGKNMHSTVLYFFSLSGVIAGFLFENGIEEISKLKGIIFFGLSQIEFLLAIYVIALMASISVHSAYIKVLEKRINELILDEITLWESEISSKFLFLPNRAFFLSLMVLLSALVIIFYLMIFSSEIKNLNGNLNVLFSVEFFIVFFLILLLAIEKMSFPKKILSKFSSRK
jgi:hypothetical protein